MVTFLPDGINLAHHFSTFSHQLEKKINHLCHSIIVSVCFFSFKERSQFFHKKLIFNYTLTNGNKTKKFGQW